MMILVDTNVFSELTKPVPDEAVVDWLFSRRHETLLSTLVVAEIEFGIRTTSGSNKRKMLQGRLERLIAVHTSRVVDFNLSMARRWASFSAAIVTADLRAGTRAFDTLIAAQALVLDVPLATRNVRHFEDTDVRIVNPWGT